VNPKPLLAAREFIGFYERFWNKKLDNLESLFPEYGEKS
jgi:hypothetical protein